MDTRTPEQRRCIEGMSQIDELYIGFDKRGCSHIASVQAKDGKDCIGVVQVMQNVLQSTAYHF